MSTMQLLARLETQTCRRADLSTRVSSAPRPSLGPAVTWPDRRGPVRQWTDAVVSTRPEVWREAGVELAQACHLDERKETRLESVPRSRGELRVDVCQCRVEVVLPHLEDHRVRNCRHVAAKRSEREPVRRACVMAEDGVRTVRWWACGSLTARAASPEG
jgi:hypothetical protein